MAIVPGFMIVLCEAVLSGCSVDDDLCSCKRDVELTVGSAI